MARLTYNPNVFSVPDEDAAKRIILTPQAGQSPDERWVRETPYLGNLMTRFAPPAGGLVVDLGCGLGRVSKEMIQRFGCRVLGVDISADMRSLAPGYVASPEFSVVSPVLFQQMVDQGLRVDGAISIWVLQHTLSPAQEIDTLVKALRPDAGFFVVNNVGRAVPTVEKAWASDGVDVRGLLNGRLERLEEGALDPAVVGKDVSELTFWGAYRRR